MRKAFLSICLLFVAGGGVLGAQVGGPGGESGTREIRPRGNSSLAAARAFENFPLYFPGESFEGLPLTAVERQVGPRNSGEPVRQDQVGFLYGSCVLPVTPGGTTGGCAPPLAVQVWRACDRDPSLYPFLPDEVLRLRGVAAAFYEEHKRLELSTGRVTVVLFGQGREQLVRAAAALRGANVSVPVFEQLPAPVRRPGLHEACR